MTITYKRERITKKIIKYNIFVNGVQKYWIHSEKNDVAVYTATPPQFYLSSFLTLKDAKDFIKGEVAE